jgi:hypothetical protein
MQKEKENIIDKILELEFERDLKPIRLKSELILKEVQELENIILGLLEWEQKKDDTVDLFDFINLFPSLEDLVNSYNENEDPYAENERLLIEFRKKGFEFEYGLDGTPFNLTKYSMKTDVKETV